MNKNEYIFTLNDIQYSIIIKKENNKIIIEAKEKNNYIPFNYNIYLNFEEIKKLDKVFLIMDSLDEVEKFLKNIFSNKDNIKSEIDESEDNMTILVEFNFCSLNKKVKFNLKKNIISKKKLIEYLINQNKLLKKENLELKKRIKSIEINNDKNIYNESTLITKEEEINLIRAGILNGENKKLKLKLLYRASKDGDTPEQFHSKCDGFSPTVSIFKTKDDFTFGGYTDIKWDTHSNDKKGENTFLFNFNYMKIYPGKNNSGIYCSKSHGPWFLYAIGVCNNSFLKLEESNRFDFNIINKYWDNFGKNYEITGGKKSFYVKEIEVFHLEMT